MCPRRFRLRPFLNQHSRARGFTVVELMVTVSIAAILAAVAAPSYRDFRREQRLIEHSNDLLATINAARSRAVLATTRAEVTPQGGWSKGWRAEALDRSANPEEPDRILITHQEIDDIDLTVVADDLELIAFEPSGALAGTNGPVNLHVCQGGDGRHSRVVVVAPSGFAEVRKGDGNDCG